MIGESGPPGRSRPGLCIWYTLSGLATYHRSGCVDTYLSRSKSRAIKSNSLERSSYLAVARGPSYKMGPVAESHVVTCTVDRPPRQRAMTSLSSRRKSCLTERPAASGASRFTGQGVIGHSPARLWASIRHPYTERDEEGGRTAHLHGMQDPKKPRQGSWAPRLPSPAGFCSR